MVQLFSRSSSVYFSGICSCGKRMVTLSPYLTITVGGGWGVRVGERGLAMGG
jgi:hypothetical protein